MSEYYVPEDLSGYGGAIDALSQQFQPPPPRTAQRAVPLAAISGLHPRQIHPVQVALGLRAALLRQLQLQGDKTFGQGIDETNLDRGRSAIPEQRPGGDSGEGRRGREATPPNINAAALKAAGSLFRELAKHHEHQAQPAGRGKGDMENPPGRRAIPVEDFILRHTQPAHHPVMRPHPRMPNPAIEGLRAALERAF